MPVTSLATVADLAVRVGEAIPTDDAQAQWFLDAASGMIRSYTSRTWLTGGVLDTVPDEVRRITVEVAARVWLNPSGNIQETVGPFTERRPELFADGFFLTGTEKSTLSKYRTSGLGGLWTIQQTKGDAYDPTISVSVSPQPGETLPYYTRGEPGAQGY